MRVRVDQARCDDLATSVNRLHAAKLPVDLVSGADRHDVCAIDGDRTADNHPLPYIHRHHQPVGDHKRYRLLPRRPRLRCLTCLGRLTCLIRLAAASGYRTHQQRRDKNTPPHLHAGILLPEPSHLAPSHYDMCRALTHRRSPARP